MGTLGDGLPRPQAPIAYGGGRPEPELQDASVVLQPQPRRGGGGASESTTSHPPTQNARLERLSMSRIEDVLGASMRQVVQHAPGLPDEALQSIEILLENKGLNTQEQEEVLSQLRAVQEQTAQATAQRVTTNTRERLERTVEAHNRGLEEAELHVAQLESENQHHSDSMIRTRLDIALRDEATRTQRAQLVEECNALRKDNLKAQQVLTIRSDPHIVQRNRYHQIMTELDPLFCQRARSVQAERHVLALRAAANSARCMTSLGSTVDLCDMTLENVADVVKARKDTSDLTTLQLELSKSLYSIDRSVREVLSSHFGLPAMGSVKGEMDLNRQSRDWKALLHSLMDATPSTSRGMVAVSAIQAIFTSHPVQCSLMIVPWARIASEYMAASEPSDWLPASCWRLVRREGSIPVWTRSELPSLDGDGFEYTNELKMAFKLQNAALYQVLKRSAPEAINLAEQGSAFGRYASDRTVFRGHPEDGLSCLLFYAQKLRQHSHARLSQMLTQMQNAYGILAGPGGDTVTKIRKWRTVIQVGIKHHLRVKFVQCVYKAAMCLRQRHPAELSEVLKPYLGSCEPEHEEDALPICLVMAQECEASLVGFASIMAPANSSQPHIRAHAADVQPYRAPRPSGGGRGRGGGRPPVDTRNRGGRGRQQGAGGRGQFINTRAPPPRGGSQLECRERGCSRSIPSDLAGRCEGANVRFRCTQCHTRANSGGGGSGSRDGGRGGQGPRRNAHFAGRGGGRGRGSAHRGGRGGRGGGGDGARHTARGGFQPFTARSARVERVHLEPLGDASQRDGFLRDERCYMTRIVRGEESLLTSLCKNISGPHEDAVHAAKCSIPMDSCTNVHCARAASDAHREGSAFLVLTLDTGASHSLLGAVVDPFLQDARPSDAQVTGFSNSVAPIKAQRRGVLPVYFMNPEDPAIPKTESYAQKKGLFVNIHVDTMAGLNDHLMSFSSLFSSAGYNLRLLNTGGKRSCSIERRNSRTNCQETIPLQYDKDRRAFVAYVCVGTTEAITKRDGRAAENALQRASAKLGRTATLADVGVGGPFEPPPHCVHLAHMHDAVQALADAMPLCPTVTTTVNGNSVIGTPQEITLKKVGYRPPYIFESPNAKCKGAPRPDDAEEEVQDDDIVSGSEESTALRGAAHDDQSYGYSGAGAVHPSAAKSRAREPTEVTSRVALLLPGGNLGWETISGALELDEGHDPVGGEAPAPTPAGTDRETEITLSSGESAGADAPAGAGPTPASRRRLDMPAGLAQGLAVGERSGAGSDGADTTPLRPRRGLRRCPTVGRRGSHQDAERDDAAADHTSDTAAAHDRRSRQRERGASEPPDDAHGHASAEERTQEECDPESYCPVCEGPRHGPESPDCVALVATTRAGGARDAPSMRGAGASLCAGQAHQPALPRSRSRRGEPLLARVEEHDDHDTALTSRARARGGAASAAPGRKTAAAGGSRASAHEELLPEGPDLDLHDPTRRQHPAADSGPGGALAALLPYEARTGRPPGTRESRDPHTAMAEGGCPEPSTLQEEYLADFNSAGISGLRRTLPSASAKSSIAELHQKFGHLGSDLDGQTCSLCAMAGGKFKRHAVTRSRAPHSPELPGYAFTADVVFFRESPAFDGSQYALVMRCMASGFYVCDYGKTKSFGAKMVRIIKGMRAKGYYNNFPYKIFSIIKSDMDGSWAFEGETRRELEALGVTLELNSVTTNDHRANAAAEAAVRFVVHTTKMILYQNRLPTQFWRMAMQQAVMLRNLFPIRKFAVSVHSGDAVRPLEQMTKYQISRSDCNQMLHALVPVGALCLVHQQQIRGSALETPNCRWGIACGMLQKTSGFFCPFAGPRSTKWYSRNYVQLKLPAGMGYHAALNIAQEPEDVVHDRLTVPPADRDIKLKNVISIPNLSSLTAPRRRVWTPITSLKTGPLHEGGTPSIIMTDEEGSIYAHTENGRIVKTSQKLSISQRQQPNIGLLDHLRSSGIPLGGALDTQRRFDPAVLIGTPRSMIGRTFWKRFDTGLWLGTVRLYDALSKLWTVTFRDHTHEDYNLREMQLYFSERIHDPSADLDLSTDHGKDMLTKSQEGPDRGPLPMALLEELHEDMESTCIAGVHMFTKNPSTGRPVDWATVSATDVQTILDAPHRLGRHASPRDQAEAGRLRLAEAGVPPEPAPRRSRRKTTPVRDKCDKAAPAPHKGATGRTAGVNPSARIRQSLDERAKRQRTDGEPLISLSGGVHPADDGLPWARTLFNWVGHSLPIPTHGEPPTADDHYEIDFAEWDDYGMKSISAPRGNDFNAVCLKLDLDSTESRLYFAWLGPTFGPRGKDGIGTSGVRFSYPWGRGSQTILDGQRFPIPCGRLWEKLKEQRRIKSNAGNTDHANIRVARAVVGAIMTNEKCHDSITRATINKVALREAYVFATEGGVHEQDTTERGTKLRVLMSKIGYGAKRCIPTLMALGVLASCSDHHWEPQIVDPFTTKTILSRQDLVWRDDSNTHIHINEEGLIDVRIGIPKGTKPVPLITAFKVKANPNSVKRGEPIVNPRTGRVMAPRTVRDIAGRPDEKIWWEAIEVEMAALEAMKVLIHDLTYNQVRAMGITSSVVPLNIVLTCKWTPLGTFERAKARCCVVGSPHFMKKGIHYGLTFAPTPSFEVTRLLMALCCAKGYARFQWDIKNAFASVPIKAHERVALRYPKGAERFDKSGRPLFAVMDRALYGVPSSSRKFVQHLQTFILKRFNTKGYKAHNTRSDPCLYCLRTPQGRSVYLSAWCDDVQCVGANIKDLEEVCAIFKETFELKICDVQELLGVRREITQSGNTTIMTLTQPGFIENTYDEHRAACELMFKKPRDTPFPPKEMLSRSEIPEDEVEAKRMHQANIKKGYMSITGSILWAARQCLPELAYGASQLCRLMSTPTDKAYEHALHMLSYMSTQKDRGIRYTSEGNRQLLACYDSSFKGDPQDSKCQYGYVIYFMNAPIAWCSRKHDHVSLSSSHAEYMALSHTARAVVWLRNLFKEMHLEEHINGPTICLGDNINANMLCKEGKVSTQNRHILLAYHYAKEAYETGEIDPRRVATRDNPSDVLTKSNPRPDIERLVPCLTGNGGAPPIPPEAERE